MSPSVRCSASGLVLTCLFLIFSSAATAMNITNVLNRYPDFSNFNQLLTQTGLDKLINSRNTITVLGISNDQMGSINGKPTEVAKSILSNHVILDYFDTFKLNALPKSGSRLTTLFQTTGLAQQTQGFINIAKKDGDIVFGSAMKGAPQDVKLEKSIMSSPYNLSVLQVSAPILVPGLDGVPMGPALPPKPKAPAASPVPSKNSPAAAPSPDDDYDADSDADAPDADGPVSDAPTPATTPAPSPSSPTEKLPADHEAASGPKSSANALVASSGLVMLVASCIVALNMRIPPN